MEVVFTHKGTFGSRVIRWATNSRVSHVSIRFGGSENKWMVEATGKGVKPGWWPYFLSKNTLVDKFEIMGIDEKLLEDTVDISLNKMIGREYDFFGIIGFALVILLKRVTGKRINNFLGSSNQDLCSEFILRLSNEIEQETGVRLYKGDLESTAPEELLVQSYKSPNLRSSI